MDITTPTGARGHLGWQGKSTFFNIYCNCDFEAWRALVTSPLEDLSHAAQHPKHTRQWQLELTSGQPHSTTGVATTLQNVLQFTNVCFVCCKFKHTLPSPPQQYQILDYLLMFFKQWRSKPVHYTYGLPLK